MIRELTCIGCPMGCSIRAELDENGKFLSAEGNQCAVGRKYSEEEVSNPSRVLTALAPVRGTEHPLPVKTSCAVPKALIFDCLEEISHADIELPVHFGDVVLRNVCDTGADVIAASEFIG